MNNGITSLHNLTGPAPISNTASAPKADVAAPPTAANLGSDQTSLSAASDLLALAVGGAHPASDVRSEKVAALQAAIANGTYSISSHDLASKIVEALLS